MCGPSSASMAMPLISTRRGLLPPNRVPATARVWRSVRTERQTRSVAGTLFGGDKPRLTEIKGISIEADLGPHMLYVTNEDKPGLIGALGSVLGDAGVNIATFHLGRAAPGADALALIEIDEPLAPEILEQVRGLEHIRQAVPLSF